MISLTPTAVAKVKALLEEEEEAGLALRVGIITGGCSGFQYEMYFDEAEEGDWKADYEGLTVTVDQASLSYLDGSVLDWKEGLMEAGFKINNPNESRSCGCGKSFS